jgi:hypothetical protein
MKPLRYTAKDGWRENKIKERQVANAIKKHLPDGMRFEFSYGGNKESA